MKNKKYGRSADLPYVCMGEGFFFIEKREKKRATEAARALFLWTKKLSNARSALLGAIVQRELSPPAFPPLLGNEKHHF